MTFKNVFVFADELVPGDMFVDDVFPESPIVVFIIEVKRKSHGVSTVAMLTSKHGTGGLEESLWLPDAEVLNVFRCT